MSGQLETVDAQHPGDLAVLLCVQRVVAVEPFGFCGLGAGRDALEVGISYLPRSGLTLISLAGAPGWVRPGPLGTTMPPMLRQPDIIPYLVFHIMFGPGSG